jgi:hypothetical protein
MFGVRYMSIYGHLQKVRSAVSGDLVLWPVCNGTGFTGQFQTAKSLKFCRINSVVSLTMWF